MPRKATVAVLLLGSITSVYGQTVLSLSLESDFRFRGVSLSDAKPDLRLSLDYDHAGGGYAGASATAVELRSGPRRAALLAYLGVARPAVPGLAWELGATVAHFDSDSRYDYGEAFAGLVADRWNIRAYVSPSYFGSGLRTLYGELNGGLPLSLPWRLFGHVGALATVAGGEPDDRQRLRFDARLGIGTAIGHWELQLAWVGAGGGDPYPMPYADRRNAWVLSSTYPF